jgi:SNF2 family DNA or RNA helicase
MANTKVIVKKYIEFCNKNNIRIQTYQIYGVLWCIRKERELEIQNKCSGGILADDMGMGKTIQMIMTIFLNFKKKTLIILPPILIQQWYSEILRIIGHTAFIYYKKNKNINSVHKSNIVITSYDTLLRSPKLFSISWDRVICDEAHRLRNHNTKIYKKISILHTNILWCITGTPIHNKISDITALIYLYRTETETKKKIKIQSNEYKSMILRRMKINTNILLPIKTEIQEIIPWTNSKELELAKDIHFSIYAKDIHSFWNTKHISELVTMIRAKQLCILPKLLEKPIQKLELDTPNDLFPNDFKYITNQNTSCKLKAIITCISKRINNRQGKIIFCHFQLEMIKITELLREMEMENNDKQIWIGNWKEFELLKKKNNGILGNRIPILILQIRAGCEGLNLQHDFSEVYFVSPNWNPTLEEQAIARCYRIGQQNKVFVFRFYMDNLTSTLEKKKIEKDIRKYFCIIKRIPEDLQKLINEYITIDNNVHNTKNYSMDQYILDIQTQKKIKIIDFIDKITI